MARLWIANLSPEASDDEVDTFLQKYGFPPFDSITRMPGDGSRPAAIVDYPGLTEHLLGRLVPRVNDMSWSGRKLLASVMPPERA